MHTSVEIIPPDWALWSEREPTLVRALSNGLTNRSYLINADGMLLVLRWNSPASAQLDLNRAAEAEALRLADRAGLCAPVIHWDPQQRYLVTRFIAGVAIDADQPADRQTLAALVREIHRQPAIATELDIEKKIAHYLSAVDPQAIFARALCALQDKIQPHIDAATLLSSDRASDRASGRVLCHNDLQGNNLIATRDGRLYAIDWEYAATGDPYFDLAVMMQGFGWDAARRERFLAQYLQRTPGASELQRLQHWLQIYRFIELLWYAVQNSHRNITGAPDRSESICREAEAQRQRLS